LKTVPPRYYALSICVAATMLVSCGGSGQLPNSITWPSLAIRPRGEARETLRGRATLIKPCLPILGKHGKRIGWETGFTAHGNSTGPYPGTFTVSGNWSSFYALRSFTLGYWLFSETFAINSGSSTISGTSNGIGHYALTSCTTLKNLTVRYAIGSMGRNAVIRIISQHDFKESLHGF
jgi:hypothetical protein